MLVGGERGLDIARWLAGQMPADRIVMVTGNVEPASVQALVSSGFRNLRKPLSSAVLAQWLHEATRHRTL
jgi:CheY-like chemotaxis protein